MWDAIAVRCLFAVYIIARRMAPAQPYFMVSGDSWWVCFSGYAWRLVRMLMTREWLRLGASQRRLYRT